MSTWTITEPQRLDLNGDVHRLDVSLIIGRLNVVGTDGPPRMEVSAVGAAGLNVALVDGLLRVWHQRPGGWRNFFPPYWWLRGRRRYLADVSIAVPYTTPSSLRTISGPVVASAIHADLEVTCVSGRTTLLGIDGRTRAKVTSGKIEALGCAGDVYLETVSGEITLADSASERVVAKTISGSVTADLDNPPYDSHISLDTVSGSITIRVREDSDLTVNLSATSGRVTSAFPELVGRGKRNNSAYGMLGGGTGKLFANAVSGSISLLRRPVADDFDGPEEVR